MAKLSAKERIQQRKQQKERRTQEFRKAEKDRQENALAEQKRAERQKEIDQIERENPEMSRKKKSRAKSAGLKSTLILSADSLLLTSFGDGNRANKEKYVIHREITNATDAPVLNVRDDGNCFLVSGRGISDARADNPLASERVLGIDQIRCKDKLEKIYFGKAFNDNIHIQAIYKILDIEKILTVHINNIVYELDNLLREDGEVHDDLIGYCGSRKTFEEFKTTKDGKLYALFSKLINQKQLGYFGDDFLCVDSKGKPLAGTQKELFEKKVYYLFAVLGTVRQATAHGEEKVRSQLYRLDELTKNAEIGKQLQKFYSDRIKKLNAGFADVMSTDMQILFEIEGELGVEKSQELAAEFFDFTILKSYKNIGFSIKRLRENLSIIYPKMKDKKYDSMRRKVNKFVDFYIWKYYKKNPAKMASLVEKLRASETEAEKELFYRHEAKQLWNDIHELIEHKLMPQMDGTNIRELKNRDEEKVSSALAGNSLPTTCSSFSQMIYLMTFFLDGKEINDLLTQLISNLENIDSFISIMKLEGIECEFSPHYKMFNDSLSISKELRVINSFARMSEATEHVRRIMYFEAARLLGYGENETISLNDYVDHMLKKEVDGKKKEVGFRNFIINNVISSSRFKYLMRYGNPDKLKKLANNRKVVEFVLKEIPDNQIKVYFNSCFGVIEEFDNNMRGKLADIIVGLSFKDFENVHQKNTVNVELLQDKERKKNIIRLYLTVLYLLVKNLIYINSRYYLAFHCVERDALLYDKQKYKVCFEGASIEEQDLRTFAKDFVDANSKNWRAKDYITHNLSNSDRWACKAFRNCVEHLNAVRNADLYINDIRGFDSYFELYHYLIQRSIMDQYAYDSKTKSKKMPGTYVISEEQINPKVFYYFKVINQYHTYCKDFVKALNIPFAYNLARYKNLSIKELFDRNHYLSHEAERMNARDTEYEL